MGKLRVTTAMLSLGLFACPMSASAASPHLKCVPAPTILDNPPEMKRVVGRMQSIDLEVREDGNRLCFVDPEA
jgi:hypothetical protein